MLETVSHLMRLEQGYNARLTETRNATVCGQYAWCCNTREQAVQVTVNAFAFLSCTPRIPMTYPNIYWLHRLRYNYSGRTLIGVGVWQCPITLATCLISRETAYI